MFSDTSEKSKRRKTGHVRELAGHNELTFAAEVSRRESGQTDAAKLVKNAFLTPACGTELLMTYKKFSTLPYVKNYAEEEALALIMDEKLSQHQYTLLGLKQKVEM